MPFQHFDDDDYTPEQREAMIKVLSEFRGKPTRSEIIRDTHLHRELKTTTKEVLKQEKDRLTKEYWEKQDELNKIGNERAKFACELMSRKDLEKHKISVEEYWNEKEKVKA